MIPTGHPKRLAINVAGADFGEVLNGWGRPLQDARIDFDAAPPGGLLHLVKEIAIGILEAAVRDLVAQGSVLVILLVRLYPDRRQFAISHVVRRHSMIRGQEL